MKLGAVSKQPAERFTYTVDYSDALVDGDTLDTVFAVVSPAGLTVEDVAALSPRVRFFADGGVDGQTYKVTLTVLTVGRRRFQDEIVFKIKEV